MGDDREGFSDPRRSGLLRIPLLRTPEPRQMRGLLLSAAVSLATAILLSAAIDASYQVPGADTLAPISDGFGQLRGIVADFLYLDLDRYHHIMMYQGYDWAQIADYLPQIWMIVKLKPDYWRAYEDGSYHLAVNLGMPDEGMRLLEEGLRNCPGNLPLLWQNAVIRWRLGLGTPRERLEACIAYAGALRRIGIPDRSPSEMRNISLISSWVMEDPDGGDSVLSARYSLRADVLDLIMACSRTSF